MLGSHQEPPPRPQDSALPTHLQVSGVLSTVGRAGLSAIVLLLAQSIVWAPEASPWLKALALGIGVLSFRYPAAGLLAVAALVPVGNILTTRLLDSYPTRGSEAFVLSFLAGLALRSLTVRHDRIAPWRMLDTWSVSFGLVAVGSCLALLGGQQLWQADAGPFVLTVLRFLAVDFHGPPGDIRPWEHPAGFEYIAVTVLLVSGLALVRAVARLTRDDARLPRRLAAALVLGGTVAAMLSLLPLVEGRELSLAGFFAPGRWSVFTPKVGAASSFFLLTGAIALGGTTPSRRSNALWVLGAVVIGLGLWLTGTRTALVAVVLIAAAVRFLASWRYGIRPRLIAMLLALVLGSVVIALAAARWDVVGAHIALALRFRFLLMQTGLNMMAAEPFFGIGIGQFFLWSVRFSSEELVLLATSYGESRVNAHNYYLQVWAELGSVGLGAFLMLLAAVLVPAWRKLMRGIDRLLVGTFAGVVGFLVTCLGGHPLVFSIVAYPFWLAVGLLVALTFSTASQTDRVTGNTAPAPVGLRRDARGLVLVAMLIVVSLAASARVWQERQAIDRTRIAYGLYDWETDDTGTRYRWTSGSATVFLDGDADDVVIPLRASTGRWTQPVSVEIYLNGSLATQMRLGDDSWRSAHVPLPPARRFHRIDLKIRPTWRPEDVIPASADPRLLGIMLGEVSARTSDGRTYNNLEIDIGASGDERFLGEGWSVRELAPQFSFRWSEKNESVLFVPLQESDDYRLEIQCGPFVYPGAPPQTIELTVNGNVFDTITVEPGVNIYVLEIPARLIRPNLNQFRFRYGYATSPASLGLSDDPRRLGVQVAMVRLTRLGRKVASE